MASYCTIGYPLVLVRSPSRRFFVSPCHAHNSLSDFTADSLHTAGHHLSSKTDAMASNYCHHSSSEQRASLESFAVEILQLVARRASSENWGKWLRRPLGDAVSEGNIDLVNALIGAGAEVCAGSSARPYELLLESAVRVGNADVVSALVAAGSPLELRTESGSWETSALFTAIWYGHTEAARRLIKAGANLQFRESLNDWDVLFCAVAFGREELVPGLLEAGANPSTANGLNRRTPLHVAARYGSTAMVSALLAREADKDARDSWGKTPLMDAAENGSVRSYRFLSAQFFEINRVQRPAEQDYPGVVSKLLTAGADVNIPDNDDGTVLVKVAEGGSVDMLNAILRYGADSGAVDRWDLSGALHMAAKNGGPAGAIHALVEAGADTKLEASDGLTSLQCATKYNNGEAMRALLQYEGERDAQVQAMLHLACMGQLNSGDGLDSTVDILLRLGADETAVDDNGRNPFDCLDMGGIDDDPDRILDWASDDEVERVRLLLNRAWRWRRRRWLVMLCSRASKARAASRDTGDSHEHSKIAAAGIEDGGCSKMTKVEHASTGKGGLLGQQVGDGCVVERGSEGGRFKAVVESLIELEQEGVFRTVVKFL